MRVPLCERFALSPEEASLLSGVGMTSLRAAIKEGKLVAHKHGVKTIIMPDDLRAWLKSLPLAA
ncbi:helix-turn-helix domain-containing protein [Bradyrhizobium arachidis]|nr:helix-turn-helix domain-containing protein [Bradyrhizobium arachidis]